MKNKNEKQKRTNSIGLRRHKDALPAVLLNKWAKPWHNPHEATGGCHAAERMQLPCTSFFYQTRKFVFHMTYKLYVMFMNMFFKLNNLLVPLIMSC